MFRRVVLALAVLTAASIGGTACVPGDCYPVHLNQNGQHPPGAAYHADLQTWTTVVAGQIHVYGYSRTIDTVIWNHRECIYLNFAEEPSGQPVNVR